MRKRLRKKKARTLVDSIETLRRAAEEAEELEVYCDVQSEPEEPS